MDNKPVDMKRETLGTIAMFAEAISQVAMSEDANLGELKVRAAFLNQAVLKLELIEEQIMNLWYWRKNMASLYELSAEYSGFLDAYDNAQSDEEAAEILQSLVDIHGELTEKGEAYAKVIRNKKSEAKAFKDEADRLMAKAKSASNLVDRLQQALLDAMKLTNTKEIVTSIGKWRMQMNPWACEVKDADKVPKKYHIPQPDKIDKLALLKEFKETGEIVDGCEFRQEQGIRFR